MRRASLSLKRNLKETEQGAAEYEDRIKTLQDAMEKSRREHATSLAKASADRRAVDMRERKSAHEASKATAQSVALHKKLKATLLEVRPPPIPLHTLPIPTHYYPHELTHFTC